ncbi:hypothetical protein [Parendozoicomonas sp. Alg238-R29]|uniref:hypothetical protein n=1 Tax=Parendozoicomonas sp. Alg238-R29 TaxID=2993446 RepID=UPI00248DF54E|nr:hypothetical protein [Parendozoicomonas sp. Alg238-R29]
MKKWGLYFPQYSSYGDSFLLKRNGPVVHGVCLDTLRGGGDYRSVYFFHNLLFHSPVITLGYPIVLCSDHTDKRIAYVEKPDDSAQEMTKKVEGFSGGMSLEKLFDHMLKVKNGCYGIRPIFLPHVYRDIVILCRYLGENIDELISFSIKSLSERDDYNRHIIGDVSSWELELRRLASSDLGSIVLENSRQLKFPVLEDMGLECGNLIQTNIDKF